MCHCVNVRVRARLLRASVAILLSINGKVSLFLSSAHDSLSARRFSLPIYCIYSSGRRFCLTHTDPIECLMLYGRAQHTHTHMRAFGWVYTFACTCKQNIHFSYFGTRETRRKIVPHFYGDGKNNNKIFICSVWLNAIKHVTHTHICKYWPFALCGMFTLMRVLIKFSNKHRFFTQINLTHTHTHTRANLFC